MKSLIKIAFSLFAGLCLVAACNDSDDERITGFTLGVQEITLGAEGGTEAVNVASEAKWVARVNQPWVKVMPANGVGSAECKIVVDTTLSNDIRQAVVTFVSEDGVRKELQVHQVGYGKMIGLSEQEVKVANMGEYGKRYFEISITTNVDFNVSIPADQGWVTLDKKPTVSLDQGARPRTVKVRFNWNMNTDPLIREATIAFEPKNPEDILEKEAKLVVRQDAAPLIEDNRQGDSIALIIIKEKIRSMSAWDTSEKMDYWDGVKLWEKTDKVPKEQIGRVRMATFTMLDTKESLPLEIGHLKYVETLIFYGNANEMLLPDNFVLGTSMADLEYLKNLTVSSYGITSIDPSTELTKPMKTLERLDLTGNYFTRLPAQITSNNFPNLISLSLGGMRRYDTKRDLRDGVWQENWGMRIDASGLVNLFRWEKLKLLSLSYGYIYGELPKMAWDAKYTDAQIAANDTLNSVSAENKTKLKTIPRILPNVEYLSLNLNFLTGDIPDWLLYHPRFARFDPFTLICTQEVDGYDPSGNVPGFKNEPTNLDYFYEFYPKAKPEKTE